MVGALLAMAVLLSRPLRAWQHLYAARQALAHYHQEEARVHLEACLELWPEQGEALLLMARAARRAEAFSEAEEYLERYRQRHGQTLPLLHEEVLYTAARGEPDRVVHYCQKWAQEDVQAAPLVWEALVQGYFRRYRLAEGYEVLQTWLAQQPDNPQALLFLAGLYVWLRQQPQALDTYRRILALDAEQDTARLRLARILLEENQPAEALPHLQRLMQRSAAQPLAGVLLARCQEALGQPEEAERLRETLLAQYPRFGPALGDRGRQALQQGRLQEAETWLRQALAAEPHDLSVRYQLVQCLFQRGQKAAAQAELQRLKKQEADLQRLEQLVNHELRQRPEDPALHLELGRLLLEGGQAEAGVYWLQRVLQANPRQAEARRLLADYYRQGRDGAGSAVPQQLLSEETLASEPTFSKEPDVVSCLPGGLSP
jgi:predicted Zn-dependent protease